jgi:hypothetical protein
MDSLLIFKNLWVNGNGTQIILGAMLLHVIYRMSGRFSPRQHYLPLSPAQKANWDMNTVSFVFSSIVCVAVLKIFTIDAIRNNPLGTDYYSQKLNAFAVSYFLWDLIISTFHFNIIGFPFFFHALACFTVFLSSFLPVYEFYVGISLMYEWSTLFLKVHWYCDKVGLTGSKLQKLNGIVLLIVFFAIRIVFGTYWTFVYWSIII